MLIIDYFLSKDLSLGQIIYSTSKILYVDYLRFLLVYTNKKIYRLSTTEIYSNNYIINLKDFFL